MHILIDGYNLIRQSVDFRRYERSSLEAGRKALINWLADYRRRRNHVITVVFDGWIGGSPFEERDYEEGIHILYSGRGVKADDVLKRITASAEEEILVVSSDREIATFAARRGKAVLSSMEFEEIVNRQHGSDFRGDDDRKLDDERPHPKKGPSHRLSRTQRHNLSKIRKL